MKDYGFQEERCKTCDHTRPTDGNRLLCLAMHSVFFAALAVFIHFHATRIVAAVLLGGVITLFAVRASQGDDRSYIFLDAMTVYLVSS